MYTFIDDDEFETVITSRPCSGCNGDRKKCYGQCNGSFSMTQRRLPASQVRAIKEARRAERENAILAEAEAILARRVM